MASTFDDISTLNRSKKISIAWLQPRERIIEGWNSGAAPVHTLTPNHFIIDVLNLTEAASASLSAGEWFYDSDANILYVRKLDDSNPALSFTVLEYRLFFSNTPLNAPYDLNSGRDVEYSGRLKKISKFKEELDADDLNGIALTGTGSIGLINADHDLKSIYNSLSWDTAPISIYIGFPEIGYNNFKKVFDGIIVGKSYGIDVKFKVKNFIEKLRDAVTLPTYSVSDGDIPDDIIGLPKRRIYGRVNGLKVQPLDMHLNGFSLSGTFTKTAANQITVTSGDLLNEVSPDDELFFLDSNGDKINFTVDSLDSSIVTLTSEIDKVVLNQELKNDPAIPYRKKNRTYLICGHEIFEATTTITSASQLNRIIVTSASNFEADDFIFVNNKKAQIRRIINNEIVLNTNLPAIPIVGQTVKKSGIQDVYIGKSKLVFNRDYTITNSSEAKLIINDEAELNISAPINISGNITFTNASTSVTGTGFKANFKTRDWIKPDGTSIYYEILSVNSETSITLRTNYMNVNVTDVVKRKRPDYINDSSIITVNCFGKKDGSGNFIKTGAKAVQDLLEEIGLANDLDTSTFDLAASDMPYLLSVAIPEKFNSSIETVREVIDKINKSIFGSLFLDSVYKLNYKTLSPNKENISTIVRRDDFINPPRIQSTGKNVAKTIVANYQHFDYGRLNDVEDGAITINQENEFVTNLTSVERSEIVDLFLYNSTDANIMAQRISLLRESPNTVLAGDTSMLFYNSSVNTPVYIEMNNIPESIGSDNQNYIGFINRISRGEKSATVSISDLSGLYAKAAVFGSATSPEFTSASNKELSETGYFTDTQETVNNDQKTYRINLFS